MELLTIDTLKNKPRKRIASSASAVTLNGQKITHYFEIRSSSNRLTQRQSVNVPLMKETIRTILSGIDDPPDTYYENLDNDKQRECFMNEYWSGIRPEQYVDPATLRCWDNGSLVLRRRKLTSASGRKIPVRMCSALSQDNILRAMRRATPREEHGDRASFPRPCHRERLPSSFGTSP